jgi:hypothetical protein
MMRGVWAGLAAGALCAGCNGPQYYEAPVEKVPPAANVAGAVVQVIDQRPEWERKPFTGVVCLYHLGKAHPDAWAQLAEEAKAVVAQMPQKPERVEVVVTSFRLVRAGDTAGHFRDFSKGPNANPNARILDPNARNPADVRQRQVSQSGVTTAPGGASPNAGDRQGNDVELAFAGKDDPRRKLRDHPNGASCSIEARVRLALPGGREQEVDVKTLAIGGKDARTVYWGEALDDAAKKAVFQFGRQFRSGVGMNRFCFCVASGGFSPAVI